jgi:hypothetical protein
MSELKIQAKEFGPMTEADVNLRPLTVFVGPNNTGKSYMAQLVYAISQVNRNMLGAAEGIPLFYRGRFPERKQAPILMDYYYSNLAVKNLFDKRTLNAFERLLPSWFRSPSSRPGFPRQLTTSFNSLPKRMQDIIQEYLTNYLSPFKTLLAKELERCFDAKISHLVCKIDSGKNFSVIIENKTPALELRFNLLGNSLVEAKKVFSLKDQTIQTTLPSFLFRNVASTDSRGMLKEDALVERIARMTVVSSNLSLLSILSGRCFYLPAARSGILYGQKAIARVGLRTLERAGIEPISIPRLPGVVIDFLDAIYSIDKNEHGDFYRLARDLERRLTPGRIEFIEGKKELPEIFFREPHIGRIELHRTSSMISELAPVVLLLRYLLKKGDMLIIEEPESHMHPGAQRELARVIIKLVRSGLNITITTHSDYLLHQLSNLIALSVRTKSQRESLGYAADEVISPDEVSVYLFRRDSNECGSRAIQLEVGEKGIYEDEFGSVAEALYEEAIEAKGN